jgi:hypothetical protein
MVPIGAAIHWRLTLENSRESARHVDLEDQGELVLCNRPTIWATGGSAWFVGDQRSTNGYVLGPLRVEALGV